MSSRKKLIRHCQDNHEAFRRALPLLLKAEAGEKAWSEDRDLKWVGKDTLEALSTDIQQVVLDPKYVLVKKAAANPGLWHGVMAIADSGAPQAAKAERLVALAGDHGVDLTPTDAATLFPGDPDDDDPPVISPEPEPTIT